jgi:methyl-accepting chemotaxis protein
VKEDDFGSSLVKGPYALTNIGHVYQKLLAATNGNFTILEDFAHYKPSHEVASFVASPIFDGSQLAGVLILQLSIAQIDTIMPENVGLGTTGETILVSSDDFLLRSNSRLLKDSTLFKQKVYNEATRASAAGEIGVKEIVDYRGKPTFVAHTPVNISGVHWSLNAKIDKSEGTKAAQQILNWMLIVMGIGIIILLIVNIFFSNSIAKPVQIMTDIAIKLANGNMNLTFDIRQRRDEIGIMANAFQQLSINLWQMMEDVVRISQGLASGNLHVMPETEYKGDFILVKNALEMTLTNLQQVIENIVKVSRGLAEGNLHVMPDDEYQGEFVKIRDALGSAIAQNIKQNWLKTGQNQLNEQLSGEQETRQLSENIINFITPYVDAQVGAFYLLVENQDSPPYLKMMASHAYMWRKNLANEFKLGEGIVGQAAFERKTIIINHQQIIFIFNLGLGNHVPKLFW